MSRRVQFEEGAPLSHGKYQSDRHQSTTYHPSWFPDHKGEAVSSSYDSKYPTVYTSASHPQKEYQQVGGWQFNMGPSYVEEYPLSYDGSQNYLQTQLYDNENPRTAVFDNSMPIILTSHDEMPVSKYKSYVVEEIGEEKPPKRHQPAKVRFEDGPSLGNFHVLENDVRVVQPVTQYQHQETAKPALDPKPVSYTKSSVDEVTELLGQSQFPRNRRVATSSRVATFGDSVSSKSQTSDYSKNLDEILATGPRWRRVMENSAVLPYETVENYEKEFFIFYTKFKDPTFPHNLPRGLRWYNIPKKWESIEHGGLRVFSRTGSDFWQETYFGKDESKDSGHFLYLPCTHSKILLETSLTVSPREQNDQAGVMIRYDRRNWVRAGLEFIDGSFQLTCVCTINGFSDWSIQEYKGGRNIEFRLYCIAGDVIIEHRNPNQTTNQWKVVRLAHLETGAILPKAGQPEINENGKQKIHNMTGLYACRPSKNSHDATSYAIFKYMSLRHCDSYERSDFDKQGEIADDTYGSFRKIAGPFIADGDYFIEPDKPYVKTYEMF